MRTTLAIDDDVLTAAKAIARRRSTSLGVVVSELARQSLPKPQIVINENGLAVLSVPGSKVVITTELINALREDED
jgi:Zn-dependent protease with chaperone function